MQPAVVPLPVVYGIGVVFRGVQIGGDVNLSFRFLYSRVQVYLVFDVGVESNILLKLFTVIDVLSVDLNKGDAPP